MYPVLERKMRIAVVAVVFSRESLVTDIFRSFWDAAHLHAAEGGNL